MVCFVLFFYKISDAQFLYVYKMGAIISLSHVLQMLLLLSVIIFGWVYYRLVGLPGIAQVLYDKVIPVK